MFLTGEVFHGLIDPASGEEVVRRRIANTSTSLGREIIWRLMTGAEPDDGPPATRGRITGTEARLSITTDAFGATARNFSSPTAGYPELFASSTRHARITWRWDDTDTTTTYTVYTAILRRAVAEGTLAELTIPTADRVTKTSGLTYFLIWHWYLRSGTLDDDGTGGPAQRVSAGLLEVLRPLVEAPNALLSETYLRAALVADITPAYADETEAVVVLSNFQSHADNSAIPVTAMRFDALLDPEQISDGDRTAPSTFTARGFDLRLQWGGEEGSGTVEETATIVLLALDTAVTVSTTGAEWERNFTLQIANATGVALTQG